MPRRLAAAAVLATPVISLALLALAPALAAPASAAARAPSTRPSPARSLSSARSHPATASTSSSKASTSSSKSSKPAAPSSPVVPIDQTPSLAVLAEGKMLFDETCATCHGEQGQGSANGANLQGVGPGVPYLWVSSGWMPLANPTAQPITKPAYLSPKQVMAIA
ncbi:MAG TPA: cytochrome c, partial [Acidimicrobiales bacterium]|nr:cytochrome c [Acidimicrobiales bacterium]